MGWWVQQQQQQLAKLRLAKLRWAMQEIQR
jgi:hypothetical protein